jgi:hypothetical protein
MIALQNRKLKRLQRKDVRKTTSEIPELTEKVAKSNGSGFVKEIIKKIGNYISKSDLNLDSWLRMEYRNDYFEKRQPKVIDLARWF